MSTNREYTQFEELEKYSDKELEKLVVIGDNIYSTVSKAAVAKRILEIRCQKKQVEAAESVKIVTKQLERSYKEILTIVNGLKEVIGVLNFFKSHWLPKQPLWWRIGAFILGTIFLGIILDLTANWIGKTFFHL
jgi:hypothetical protein